MISHLYCAIMCHLLLPIGPKTARVQRVSNCQVKTGVHTPQRLMMNVKQKLKQHSQVLTDRLKYDFKYKNSIHSSIHSLQPNFIWYHKSFTEAHTWREKGHFKPKTLKNRVFWTWNSPLETLGTKNLLQKKHCLCQIKAACRTKHICLNLCFLVSSLEGEKAKRHIHGQTWVVKNSNNQLWHIETETDIFQSELYSEIKGTAHSKIFSYHVPKPEWLSSVEQKRSRMKKAAKPSGSKKHKNTSTLFDSWTLF